MKYAILSMLRDYDDFQAGIYVAVGRGDLPSGRGADTVRFMQAREA
jgi:hypothetical protein